MLSSWSCHIFEFHALGLTQTLCKPILLSKYWKDFALTSVHHNFQLATNMMKYNILRISSLQSLGEFFSFGSTAQFWALAGSMKHSVSFRLLDLGQWTVLLGRVTSSSQGLC
jgi:hypothetical protein